MYLKGISLLSWQHSPQLFLPSLVWPSTAPTGGVLQHGPYSVLLPHASEPSGKIVAETTRGCFFQLFFGTGCTPNSPVYSAVFTSLDFPLNFKNTSIDVS